jgi:autotransporter-associated beta strand protein
MKKCIACRASRNHRRLLAALSVGIGLAAQSAFAVDFVWTRGASNNNWDAAANWAGAVAPPVAPATGDTTNIIFSGTSVTVGTSLSLRQNYVIDSMTFASDFVGSGLNTVSVTTPSTLLTGATSAHLTIGAGGITSNVVDFNLNIQKNVAIPDANLFVPVDQTWALNAPAASTGAKTFSVSREVVGTGRVTKTGTGVLVLGGLTANANWSGGFDLVEGSVRTGGLTSGHNGHFGTGSISSTSANDVSITASTVTGQGGGGDRVFDNDLTLGGTGQLQLAGGFNLGFTSNSTWTLVGNKRLATSLVTNHDGNITGGFGITKLGGGMLVLSGASNYTGNTDVVEGVVHVRNSAGLGGGSAAVSVGSLGVGLIGSGLELSNGITVSGRTLSLAGTGVITAVPPVGVDANAGALRNRSGNNTWTGQVSATAPDTLIAVDSGELNLSGGLDGAGTARVAGAGLLRVANVRAAGLTIDGSTVVRVNADGTSAGRSTVSALSLAGGPGTPTATLDLTNNALVAPPCGSRRRNLDRARPDKQHRRRHRRASPRYRRSVEPAVGTRAVRHRRCVCGAGAIHHRRRRRPRRTGRLRRPSGSRSEFRCRRFWQAVVRRRLRLQRRRRLRRPAGDRPELQRLCHQSGTVQPTRRRRRSAVRRCVHVPCCSRADAGRMRRFSGSGVPPSAALNVVYEGSSNQSAD